MKRPDADLIRRLIKANMLDDRGFGDYGCPNENWTLDRVLGLPYFYLSYKKMEEFNFDTDGGLPDAPDGTLLGNPVRVLENRGNSADLVRSYASGAEFVYDEFVLSAKSEIQLGFPDASVETVSVNYWGVITPSNHPDHRTCGDAIVLFIDYPEAPRQTFVWEGWTESRQTVEPDGGIVETIEMVMTPEYKEAMTKWHQGLLNHGAISGEGGFDQFISGLTNQAAHWYLFICRLMGHIKYGDKHVVEVTPTPDKLAKAKRNPANRKRPWNKASGPHVLLLDRMPTGKTESTGTHASPKPHRRRGHWKTLSHPRFRHHPQYQKKIYVKPSFVGERQVTYEGNVYRLVEPLDTTAC